MIRLPSGSRKIFRALKDAGFECYLVGGWVRDRLLEVAGANAEADFTTNARPADVLRIFPGSHYRNRFGTVLVRSAGRYHEVTTYRGEGRYSDHRHPDEVRFVDSLLEDLQRRDFTINAMAMDEHGGLTDPFGGRADLDARLIRAVGDPAERLAEDPLRMMRAARLSVQLDLAIETRTAQGIRRQAGMLAMISRERIRDELMKILSSDRPVMGIELLEDLRLLPTVLPVLSASFQESALARPHALETLRHVNGDHLERLAALLHVLPEARAPVHDDGVQRDLNGLRLSNAETLRVSRLIAGLLALPGKADEQSARRLMNALGKNLDGVLSLGEAHARSGATSGPSSTTLVELRRLAGRVESHPHTLSELAIDGNDLMRELSLPPGPRIGRLLAQLLDLVLEDPSLNERETLLEEARGSMDAGGRNSVS
jgi:tRNA nucleotidyltransferase/poly(A) polymerase